MGNNRKSNGGLFGVKLTTNSGIFDLDRSRGRDNGGVSGLKRIFATPAENVDKYSGFWNMDGTKFQINGHSVTTSTPYSYQENYWVYPEPYQTFTETSRYFVASGTWDPHNCDGDNEMWAEGTPWDYGSDYSWVEFGSCPDLWVWEAYQVDGYYEWVYPSPYLDTRTVSGVSNVTTNYNIMAFF